MSKNPENEQIPLVVLKDDNQFDKAMNALTKIEEVEATPVKEPMQEVETSLVSFLQNSMKAALAGNELSSKLEQSLINSLDDMTVEEKLTLYNISQTTHADILTRIINPAFGAIDSARQARAPKEDKGNTAVQINVGTTTGDNKIAESVNPEIIGGLQTLNLLIQALGENNSQEIKES